MTPELWSTMPKRDREKWHREMIDLACEGATTRRTVRFRMLSKQFGVDLTPYYQASRAYRALPED